MEEIMTKSGLSRKQRSSNDKTQLAIINPKKCKPKKCGLQCKKKCPIVRQGKKNCVVVHKKSTCAIISESLCTGCGVCTSSSVCPFGAIKIINLPKNLASQTVFRYGKNSFKLHRLPTPRPGQVLGLIGNNGIGKSTALKILSGQCLPNFGDFDVEPSWDAVTKYFRGSELQKYFTKLSEGGLKVVMKPQYVSKIPDHLKNEKVTVRDILFKNVGDGDVVNKLVKQLDLAKLLDRCVKHLSGGELQRFAIAVVCSKNAGAYIFDEPSSFLDIKQRLVMADVVKGVVAKHCDRYVIVVEHDLSILDYLSDFICCLYGEAGAYGVVTFPYGVREGINVFLDGYIPTENMRFRPNALHFRQSREVVIECEDDEAPRRFEYPASTQTRGTFELTTYQGHFTTSQITMLLGENGTGKTTFIKHLTEMDKFSTSYKPQNLSSSSKGSVTVYAILLKKLGQVINDIFFKSTVIKPMKLDKLFDNMVSTLSGGELQRLAVCLCLGKSADIYLIDEPSAYLDVEQRIIVGKVIKKFITHKKKSAFIVEHDFVMATYLADQVILFEGEPAIKCIANTPQSLVNGMNKFLKNLNITFRRDPTNHRPRINKQHSVKDTEQKKSGNYFLHA